MAPELATILASLADAIDQQLHPDENDFVGRAYVRDEIAKFLAVRNRMLVLAGPPGIGKTALAAQLVRENMAAAIPYLAHFCSLSGDDNPYTFCDALAQQLQALLGEGYSLPDTVRKQQVTIQASANIAQASGNTNVKVLTLNIGGMHPREAFRQAVREPLRAFHDQHGGLPNSAPLLIVIDGLDRAWEWDGGQDGNIVSMLADAQDLPPWINLICTARPGPAVQTLRAQAGVRVVDLQGPANLDDIATFFRERFLGTLPAEVRAHFEQLVAADAGLAAGAGRPGDAFVAQAVAASQGNFLFVRRYAGALRAALLPGGAQPSTDPAALLRFDNSSLASVLDTTYAATLEQLHRSLEATPNDADNEVLATLAIAFEPLSLPLLSCISGQPASIIAESLNQRLKAVLVADGDDDARTYAFYHNAFGDYVRRQLSQQGRPNDVLAAQRLELADDNDPEVREYRSRFRWAHLLRGLDLADAARDQNTEQEATPAPAAAPAAITADSVAQIREHVHDPVIQAQLLRGLATRALDPSQSNAMGSWRSALSCLRAAEHALRHSRALSYLRQRGWQLDGSGPASAELVEMERTLMALGDAYSTIARRMDPNATRPRRPSGIILWLHLIWDMLARLPLTLYLLFVLIQQGVREVHIPGALQNLGRGQDWTVARLCVLSVSAYRRARALARARNDDDSYGEVTQRLARLYMLMGAYDAAAATYESLLARPSTLTRVWRQAMWRLELGEVLVAQERAEQAVEVLNSALPVFVRQEAPTQQARALSALAAANSLRADAADSRRDGQVAAALDDLTIRNCQEALDAWANVTTLQGDETASVDPALAISTISHQLWRAARTARISDEQRHRIRAMLDGIVDRHFPQRFEHPFLRLFRVSAAVFLPAYLLFGLLMAVQLPTDVTIQTQTQLTFPPPLIDMARFPNDLVNGSSNASTTNDLVAGRLSGRTALDIGSFDVLSLTQLAGSRVTLQPSPPALDPLGTSRRLLWIMGLYLLTYTVFGITVISFSSPAQFQNRRPGRLILGRANLVWHGPAGQGSLMDAVLWLRQDLRSLLKRLYQPIARLRRSKTPASTPKAPSIRALSFAEIGTMISIDRRAFGYLLADFSMTLIQPHDATRRALLIPGTLTNYPELCDELELRLRRPRRFFSVEIIRSVWGLCFLATLLYALVLVLLLTLRLAPVNQPMLLGYSLVNLYIVATPGLLIPLLWWFVAQPLGANSFTAGAPTPLIATAAVGGGLTAGVLANQIDLSLLGLRPDLATPVLAGGFMLAIACYAPPRPFRLLFSPRPPHLLRNLLALAALAGLLLLCSHTGTTLRWYDALVRGNRFTEQALASPDCAANPRKCPPITQAIASYSQVICLRPRDSDGYAFRGFAYLVQGEYAQSRDDFARALGEAAPRDACTHGALPAPSAAQQVGLYANLGAVDTLLARSQSQLAAESHYASALANYARALHLDTPSTVPDCSTLAAALAGDSAALALQHPAARRLAGDQAQIVLQLADTCYSRGSGLAGAPTRDARDMAWRDLAAAITEYHAAAGASDAPIRDMAQRGEAAAWLAIGQIDQPPGQPNRATALLHALNAYGALAAASADTGSYTGQAWSSIQLGAWGDARAPLAAAARLNPSDPTYPALQGLTYWLDSTQYDAARKGAPSLGYTIAISNALEQYTRVIAMGGADLTRAYATRSLLNFSLRNSPRPGAAPDAPYQDADYSIWMRHAIADASSALQTAERQGTAPAQQAGYRYWRARMQLVLALTLQQKGRGLHDWNELAALYSGAYADYTAAASADALDRRRAIFTSFWIPWSHALLVNANHLQLAQEALRNGNYAAARAELALVDARVSTFQKWDRLSAPLPDAPYMQGLVALGLGDTSSAASSYAAAVAATENQTVVPQRGPAYPDDARPAIYRAEIANLDRLLAAPPPGWPAAARAAAERTRMELAEQLDATQTGSGGLAGVPAPNDTASPFANR
jgi:hypothetical protein